MVQMAPAYLLLAYMAKQSIFASIDIIVKFPYSKKEQKFHQQGEPMTLFLVSSAVLNPRNSTSIVVEVKWFEPYFFNII